MNESLVDDYLSKISQALRYYNVTTEVVIALLIILCLMLLAVVVYLWQARGTSSLSRQVM